MVILAFAVTLLFGGKVVTFFLARSAVTPPASPQKHRFDPGAVIGRCENIITLLFVLIGEPSGVALVFAAKSIARIEQVKENASYYLGGTLVNLVWGLFMALLTRVIIFGIPIPKGG